MYDLDMDLDVRRDVEGGPRVRDYLAGRESNPPPVVDARCVRRKTGYLVPVQRGVSLRGRRPCARIGSCFAGEGPSVEVFKGGVHVVRVEHDVRREPILGVELGDADHFDAEIPLLPVAVWGRYAGQGEAVPADRNDARRYVCQSLSQSPKIRDHDIAPFPDTDVHHATTIADKTVVGQ